MLCTTRNGTNSIPPPFQVSIVAGMTAGVAGAIVSQPADTILTRINTVRQPAPVAAAPAPPVPERRNPWDLRPSLATVGSSSSPSSSGASAAGAFGRGRAGVGLMEKEASSSSESVLGQEGGAAEGSAPDWKEVVREMFEEGEGVGGLFRCVTSERGGGERERDGDRLLLEFGFSDSPQLRCFDEIASIGFSERALLCWPRREARSG